MKSKGFSFENFKVSKNFLSALKKVVYVLVPAIITELVAHNIITTSLAALIGPMIFQSIEYYFKEYKK